ncbi:uncharacterized protein [Typha angustifolia]|uniref:uncharacterized protein n=1 Tax=Typha angustifolia TaxID=59011 RepID=UPI003C2F52DD
MSSTFHPLLLPNPPNSPLRSNPWTGLRINPFFSSSSLPFSTLPKKLPEIPPHSIRATSSHRHPFPSSPTLFPLLLPPKPSSTAVSAGRSKKNKSPPGRIEGGGAVRRQAKANARRRSRRVAENLFYRRNKLLNSNQADFFSDEELQMIGLGYDRAIRFMSGPDDPNLRHPFDWYKYGKYGPYSWRGIVVGPPIRGRFSDDRVSLIGEVGHPDEWDEIEQFEMANQFSQRLAQLDATIGLRYYWVFARHPKWRASELPWQQWTLVAEVVVEARKQERIDKWSLMGRLGNRARAMITQCAAWMRPDIIYVKRPVYQCRFEPQEDFFKVLGPLLDPETENDYLFEVEEEGRVVVCTYFGGLCRLVKISPKAYVDDVVKAYQKLTDEGKSRCLHFLLGNHPMELLHPYTKEWKIKLEEMELGCDAPDGSDDDSDDQGDSRIIDWIEDDEDGERGEQEDDEDEEEVIDVGEEESEEVESNMEESEEYWNEQWDKAMRSSEDMEKLVKKSVEVSTEYYKRQMTEEQRREDGARKDELRTVVLDQEQSKEEWESAGFKTNKRRVKSKIPPELFLRAAVRPFTYRNLVKEIVLMRHAIIDGDIGRKSWAN